MMVTSPLTRARNVRSVLSIIAGALLILLSGCSTTTPSPAPAAEPTTTIVTQPIVFSNGEHLAGIGSETLITVHGTIVSVDKQNQLVTLQGPKGKPISLHVYNPYNLAAAQPGEPFVARFYEIVTVRKKQPGETIPAASLQEGLVSASPGQTPGAAYGNQIQMVATITAIDTVKNTVELKGPDGTVETVDVANPDILAKVKVGDEIVMSLTNVVAIALEKESQK